MRQEWIKNVFIKEIKVLKSCPINIVEFLKWDYRNMKAT